MTVLQRNTTTGLSDRGKRIAIVVAMVVAGVIAAFGVSQLVDSDTAGGTAHQVLSERDALMGANVETLTRTGLAQAEAMKEWATLQHRYHTGEVQSELAQANAATRSAAGQWTLEDELNALHQERNAPSQPPAQPYGPR